MKIFKKYDIDVKSFFKKGLPKKEEPFFVGLLNGRMGTGKSYLTIKLTIDYLKKDKRFKKIKTNIHSLKIKDIDVDIDYFDTIDSIVNDNEEYCIYIFDELGKKYTCECKQDKDFYNFLQMSRKCKRIVFLIHQEYLQTPKWLRGVVQYVFTTHQLLWLPIFVTYKGLPYLSEDKEWLVSNDFVYIYKRTKDIGSLYDTFETVNTL